MGVVQKEIGCQIDSLEWPVSEHLPIVAECLHSLPIGWTYLCVSEGVCFAHVKIGSTRKNVVCDKAVYLSVVDGPQKSSSYVIEELRLEIELRDMISFEGRIFRRRVAKCLDIIDLLKEIASGSDDVGRESEITYRETSVGNSVSQSSTTTQNQLRDADMTAPVSLAFNPDEVKYQDQQQLQELKAQEQQIKLQEIQLHKLQEQQQKLLLSPPNNASTTEPSSSRDAVFQREALMALERESHGRRLVVAQQHHLPSESPTALVAARKQPLTSPQQPQSSQKTQQSVASSKADSPDQRELLYDTEPQTQPQNLSVNSGAIERSGVAGTTFKIKKEPGIHFPLNEDSMQRADVGANNRLLALAGAGSSASTSSANALALVPVSSLNTARQTPSEAGSLESREVQETLRMKHESSSSALLARDARELQHQLQQQQLQRAAVAAAAAAGQSSTHAAFGSGSFGLPPTSTAALQSIPGFASWMQQQQLASGGSGGLLSPTASSGGDPRRELMVGGNLHFDHDDAFQDSMDLDRSGGPSSLALAVNEGERPHKCRICGRGFKTKAHHMRLF